MRRGGILAALLVGSLTAWARPGDAPDTVAVAQAREQARMVLARRCMGCHGGERAEAGLRLDRPEERWPASLLQRVEATDASRMPPEGPRLTAAEIALLRTAAGPPAMSHWAWQPLRKPVLPAVRQQTWPRQPLDYFILARLEAVGLAPSPPADRHTLIRRLYLDLLGLLPSSAAVAAFVSDTAPDAYERLVDELLASPHFGERWARHWLDLIRYADSNGYEHDALRRQAYRHRDWVIAAINADLPYDEFTVKQLAGDLLPEATEDDQIAAGLHRHAQRHDTAEMVAEEYRTKAIKDRVNVTGQAWLGLTVGCAECHDHKFDPLTQREYYRLYAFFNDAQEEGYEHPERPEERVVLTFRKHIRATHVHLRGSFDKLGPLVEPGVPAFLPPLRPRAARADRLDLARWLVQADNPLPARVAVNQLWQPLFGTPLVSTPDDFGQRGAHPTHPDLLDYLAHRWRELGWRRKPLLREILLSATYQQAATHRPDLAARDPANRWLGRQNRWRVEAEVVHDLLLGAAGLLRTEPIGGPSFQLPFPPELDLSLVKNNQLLESTEDRFRRGLYIQVQRTFPHPFLALFDAPDGLLSCSRRERTTTPLQALFQLNNSQATEAAQALALLLEQQAGDDQAKLTWGWQRCLTRPPTAAEVAILERLLSQDGWLAVASTLLNLDEFLTRE